MESVERSVVKPLINLIDGGGGVADVNVDEHMTNFTRGAMSRLCFGSNSSEGEDIFLKLEALAEIISKLGPIYSALPLLRKGVESRLELVSQGVIDQTMPFHEVQAFEFRGDNLEVQMGFAGGRVRVSFDSCVAGVLVGNVFEVKNCGFKPKRSGERV
ncbi:hypothetical protein FEM48_Zijuj10G0041300 [Ziziphus jujuba var. spinosa]|uniref:Uncharacterized protein n=1 Tax=Ziziphus jujuba var. spinosa TaxID=714518 RepID=A0A978UL74_ZIZJJ|nr:hypothetical protein FEM48_Zijuj10G0041300 [Ziziphus jujuba var. spinosa]